MTRFKKELLKIVEQLPETITMGLDDDYIYEYIPFEYNCGATKVAIFFGDYVIKLPINYCIDNSNFDDEVDYEDVRNPIYEDFCKTEAENFLKAKERNVDDFFVETQCFKLNGRNIYLQRKVECHPILDWIPCHLDLHLNDKELQKGIDFRRKLSEIKSKIGAIDYIEKTLSATILNSLLNHYEPERIKLLNIFLQEHQINDLEDRNCCLINGKIKFFDYSGFNEEGYYGS